MPETVSFMGLELPDAAIWSVVGDLKIALQLGDHHTPVHSLIQTAAIARLLGGALGNCATCGQEFSDRMAADALVVCETERKRREAEILEERVGRG